MRTLFAAALALSLWAGSAMAHAGHDHGSEASVASPPAPRGSSGSENFELVAVARNGTLTVYLDRANTNEPVTTATIQADTPAGKVEATQQPDGSYRLDATWSSNPGEYEVLFTIDADGVSDMFPVTLDIHAPTAEPARAAAAWATTLAVVHDVRQHLVQRDPVALLIGGGGFVLGGLVVLLVHRRRLLPAFAVLALTAGLVFASSAFAQDGNNRGGEHAALVTSSSRDLAQRRPDGGVFVPKPTQRILSVRTTITTTATMPRTIELPGRVIPDPNASGVVQSSVGGRLSPPPGGFPRLGMPVKEGDVLAYVTPPVQAVDVSDMRQRQGELEQQIAIVQRRVERYSKLVTSGAVSVVQLDEAQAELKGLSDRRAALDRVRQQSEALIAPVGGVVAEVNAVAGQMAGPGAQVFMIVDPRRLWVEALSFDALSAGQTASARLADGRTMTLVYRGAGLADRNQAVPVQFAVVDATTDLRTGQFVTVLASTTTPQHGLALPRASVVRGANGQSIVYEHTKPEHFEPREVRVEPLDADRVLVLSGLAAGQRVVTQGAELLNQVR
ncbi:efflux RND transporter periplasmic adaptor subunit [Methylobacterium aquaticum]|uniref:efflux RND transporter periplasmic adaptor subunit n=1 Tax=Methylobacterium aquaticum TaxID=270351 RepID=UPI001931FF8D|nr:efflux RND transporter periplasmic adaptor subunit [Methylobacterium aquaticum]QRE78229.1 efflux RND transporter periplasmic adaptor subunit [Methylobacterium aquaticum]